MVIGLTGYYCSGKSTVEKIIVQNYPVELVDVDHIGHEVLYQLKAQIVEAFGKTILNNNHEINRKVLGTLVFQNPAQLDKLNSLVHPVMIKKVQQIIQTSSSPIILVNAALLFQMGLNGLCDKIIVVKTSFFHMLLRGMKRDHFSVKKIFSIINRQKAQLSPKMNANSDDIYYINNWNNQKQLATQVKTVWSQLI
ncbi:MAG: dephospho-CoA kinase [Spirochaetes bacterium]|nr:dephospho-CoA kinase [Spirochaetota bacterium]